MNSAVSGGSYLNQCTSCQHCYGVTVERMEQGACSVLLS